MDKQRRKELLKAFKKKPLAFIREAINNRVEKAEKRIRNEVKREVLAEVRDALTQGNGQQQQQTQHQQSSSMRDPASNDPVVNEAIQGQDQTDFAKEAVRQGVAEKKSGGNGSGGGQFESVDQIKNQISQLQESVQSGNQPHPADQMMQQQQGGTPQQQAAPQQRAAPAGGGGMDQGMSQLNPAAAAALGKKGGAPGGGGAQPMDPQQAQSPAGAAHPQKSATTGGQQQGVQQGNQQDWPTVDGNQKMGGAVPNQPQGGAAPGGKDNVRNHGGQVPDHVRQVANRDYSELVNRFNK